MNQNRTHAPVIWKRGLVSLLVTMLVLNLCMPGIMTRAEELPAQEETSQTPVEGTVLPEGEAAEENLQLMSEEESQEEITQEDTKEENTEADASQDTPAEDTVTGEDTYEGTTKEDTAAQDTETIPENGTQTEGVSFYDQLMAAETCSDIFEMMTGNSDASYALTLDELSHLASKVEAMEDDGYKVEVTDTIAVLKQNIQENNTVETGTVQATNTPATMSIELADSTYTANGSLKYGNYSMPVYLVDYAGKKLDATYSKTMSSDSVTISQYTVNESGYTYAAAVTSTGVVISNIKIQDGQWYYGYKVESGPNTSIAWATEPLGADDYIMLVYTPSQMPVSGVNYVDHLEVEVDGGVTVTIGEKDYPVNVEITTSDEFTVTAEYNGTTYDADDGFFYYYGNKEGNGSTDNDTVELSGNYPVGTSTEPVYYNISIEREITVELEDGTILTVPVTLSVKIQYYSDDNNCPGYNGYYDSNAGIDVKINGEYVGQAITKGKLAIQKTVNGEENSTAKFQFYLQNSAGDYLTFSNNACTGTSDTLTDACKVTVTAGQSLVLTDIEPGIYTITEIQKDGYIITDAEGNASNNYTKDYIVETKNDDEIPIANFTNKKLSNQAGIKIKKVGNGLSPSSYKDPTVAIYRADDCTNGVPNDGATVLWTGTLTTNSGEFIYLNVTLPAGEYVVVETGADVVGYNLTTTLTVDSKDASGMSFTAVSNKVHELVVTNIYTEQPKVCDLTISKTVTGNMGDWSKEFSFKATLSGDGYSFAGVTYSINDGAAENAGTGTTCEFSLKHGDSVTFTGLPIGATFKVEETGADDYETTVNGEEATSKTITLAENNSGIAFVNNKNAVIETGVTMDSFPMYLLMSTMIVFGGLLLTCKRRYGDWM